MADVEAPQDRVARLRLICSDNIGVRSPISSCSPASAAPLAAILDLAARGGGRMPKLAERAAVEREMESVARLGDRYLFLGQGLHSPLLAEVETAPPALIVRGDLKLLDRPAVAMVGAGGGVPLRPRPRAGSRRDGGGGRLPPCARHRHRRA